MKYNGKKFSEIILEQDPNDYLSVSDVIKSKSEDLKQAEFMGKPVGGKFLGYNEQGEPEYELPGVTVKPPRNKVKLQFNISKDGGVGDIKTKSTTSKPPIS